MPVLLVPPIVTGASGFVGHALGRHLGDVRALSLSRADWRSAVEAASFRGATVYHLAARVHGMAPADDAAYLRDNEEKTRVLAQRAARDGAHAFIFLSTIKVNGEETRGRAFTPQDEPHPEDAYARSKLAAEMALARIASETGLRIAVVRSPLVYGPRPKGNLAALCRLAATPWPLPFASLHAPRSFVSVDDLCGALMACAKADARGIYLAAHPEPVTTARLVTLLRQAMGRPARLYSMPPAAIEVAAAIAGQGERARRLTRALVVDASRLRQELGWQPRNDIEAAVRELVAA